MRPDSVGLGGFDSHALPPRGRRAHDGRVPLVARALCVLVLLSGAAGAQRAPDARAGISDTTRPPVTPTRAFLYSLAIPGLGQAKLDRPRAGAGFFLVEALSLAMIHRTADDLRLARAYRRDSIPLTFVVDMATGVVQLDGKGSPAVATWQAPYYSDAIVRSRRLQLEDWSAVLVFNHLIAGAEAFVAAQLWDLPQHVKWRASPVRGGLALSASIGTR